MKSYQIYKLSQVIHYLRKAERILENLQLLNHKIESDFYAVRQFCNDEIKCLKSKEISNES